MAVPVPWPALGALLVGVLSTYFLVRLWRYRHRSGAKFFLPAIGCVALWQLSYGAGLLVFDPTVRWLFEIPIWTGINFGGVLFLAFALEYTGRGRLVRSKWFGGIVAVQGLHTLIVATNPIHHVAWRNYRIDAVFDAATVTYTHEPWLFVNVAGIYLLLGTAMFLLLDTFVSYGRVYRKQTIALALSPIPPMIVTVAWVFQLGPVPQLNLGPYAFAIHLVLDMYAFFRRNMFELTPATQRLGERAVIDDLGSAVVIVDDDRHIVTLNEAAESLFDVETTTAIGQRLDSFIGDDENIEDEGTVRVPTAGAHRTFAVASSPLVDAGDIHVGRSYVFHDVTGDRRRKQRLEVLNRVLRHNLRNNLNVVQSYLDLVDERIDDEDVLDMLGTARTQTSSVVALAEKARRADQAFRTDAARRTEIDVDEMLDRIVTQTADSGDAVDVAVPADLRLSAVPEILEVVFYNLIENALEHTDADPSVEIELLETDPAAGTATFAISDNGPGIPDHERAIIERGEETPLEHGSGLGLWLVRWGVTSLGGDISFETPEDGGTTVVVELPGLVSDDDRE